MCDSEHCYPKQASTGITTLTIFVCAPFSPRAHVLLRGNQDTDNNEREAGSAHHAAAYTSTFNPREREPFSNTNRFRFARATHPNGANSSQACRSAWVCRVDARARDQSRDRRNGLRRADGDPISGHSTASRWSRRDWPGPDWHWQDGRVWHSRSEEHTSELQSPSFISY